MISGLSSRTPITNGATMAKKATVVSLDIKRELAKEFVGLVLPRVLETYTGNLESIIENLRAAAGFGSKERNSKHVRDLLKQNEAKMVKILSGEPALAIEKFYVDALSEEFSEEELRNAVFQERFTVKFGGLAARAEAVFAEALGEVTQGGNLETDAGAVE